jgi:hypothetical protein
MGKCIITSTTSWWIKDGIQVPLMLDLLEELTVILTDYLGRAKVRDF